METTQNADSSSWFRPVISKYGLTTDYVGAHVGPKMSDLRTHVINVLRRHRMSCAKFRQTSIGVPSQVLRPGFTVKYPARHDGSVVVDFVGTTISDGCARLASASTRLSESGFVVSVKDGALLVRNRVS